MTKQEQLAEFLGRRMMWQRFTGLYWLQPYEAMWQPRPTAEALAQELLQDAEFRALRLGTWLGTTDGEVTLRRWRWWRHPSIARTSNCWWRRSSWLL